MITSFAFRLVAGLFLCYLGYEIYCTHPGQQPPRTRRINGLLGTYVATFLLTLSNPVTILSFAAIYAAWHAQSMTGHYGGAAVFASGVFIGSASWWVALFLGLRCSVFYGGSIASQAAALPFSASFCY